MLTDADLDGLLDADERALGADPFAADSDGDGLTDNDEVHTRRESARLDTDGDGWSDSAESGGYESARSAGFPSIPIAGPGSTVCRAGLSSPRSGARRLQYS